MLTFETCAPGLADKKEAPESETLRATKKKKCDFDDDTVGKSANDRQFVPVFAIYFRRTTNVLVLTDVDTNCSLQRTRRISKPADVKATWRFL